MENNLVRDTLSTRFGAMLYEPVVARGERLGMRQRREKLLAAAHGRVVEIGAGTGLNLPHYPAGLTGLTMTEPVPAMFRRLSARAGDKALPALADALPMPDASVDTVVSTLVLCTVPEVEPVLDEIRRVLKPGGRLLFCEHVLARDRRLARRQRRLAGLWAGFAQGCRCDRDTLPMLRERFEIESITETRWQGMPSIVRPLIVGIASVA
ncbi:class I SAM-dependent methyltransferase [Actinocrispum sp. NPDC049592]|uniref:class I SAM-dependent methyltransferase n=1 Tax=Actinocrispum sp. NPDC049592 TaxID=3154835 RepID=UPI003442E114